MKKLFFILIITFLPTIISAGVWYEPLTGNLMLAPKAEDIEYGNTTVKAGLDAATAGAGANALGYYLLTRSTNAPTNGVNLGSLSTGLLKLTVAEGIATPSIASPGTDYLTPAGSGAALTGITASQVGAAAASHAHSGADITSGTVGISYLPTGTTSSTVSLGNHTHASLYQPLGGSIDWANPVAVTDTATLTIGKHHVVTVTSADKTLTLPAVSGNAGKLISIEIAADTTKLITIDGNSSETIDGAATRIMWAKETAILLCNGTSWTKIAGNSIPMSTGIRMNANQTFSASTFTNIAFDASLFNNAPSAMQDIANHRLKVLRDSLYCYSMSVSWAANATQQYLTLGINGTASGGDPRSHVNNGSAGANATSLLSMKTFTAGQLITCMGFYNAGTPNPTVIGDTSNVACECWLIMTEIPTW